MYKDLEIKETTSYTLATKKSHIFEVKKKNPISLLELEILADTSDHSKVTHFTPAQYQFELHNTAQQRWAKACACDWPGNYTLYPQC